MFCSRAAVIWVTAYKYNTQDFTFHFTYTIRTTQTWSDMRITKKKITTKRQAKRHLI